MQMNPVPDTCTGTEITHIPADFISISVRLRPVSLPIPQSPPIPSTLFHPQLFRQNCLFINKNSQH